MPHLHHGYNFTAVPHVLKSSISDERRIRSNVSQYLLLSFSLLLNIVQESAKSIKKKEVHRSVMMTRVHTMMTARTATSSTQTASSSAEN